MHVTIAEFSQLYPEWADIAADWAEVIDQRNIGRALDGQPTYPDTLLEAICCFRTGKGPAARDSKTYWQAWRRIQEQRSAAIAARFGK